MKSNRSFLVLALCLLLPAVSQGALKEWTVMVFMNADNNLSEFGTEDMQEAVQTGSSSEHNVIFQLDLAEEEPCCRYFIEKGEAKLLADMGEVDMGDMATVIDFVSFCHENYPAKKYLLILWNHGSGWRKSLNDKELRGISYDDQSGNHISTKELAVGLREVKQLLGKKLDILAFDACLMQMVEVAWAVRESASLMIASEETEPVGGYHYESALQVFHENPKASAADVANHFVRAYYEAHNGGAQGQISTTQSWVDLGKVEQLKAALDIFAQKALGKCTDEFFNIQFHLTKFYYPENKDLHHFMKLVQDKVPNPEIKTAAALVQSAVEDYVGLALNSKGAGLFDPDYKNAFGAAIYFPSRKHGFKEKYLELDFAQDGSWDEFMVEYLRILEESKAR